MRRRLASGWVGALLLLSGCATGPLLENPALVRPAAKADSADNPVYIPLRSDGEAYARLFSHILDVIGDYGFDIAYSNRYDSLRQIETFPKISPGLGQPWKLGSPDVHQRLVASFQTIRHRAVVKISPAADGGYFVEVKVFKELQDLPRPSRATAGAAAFRSAPTVERQFEVVEVGQFENGWIPVGEDVLMEQDILDRIVHFDSTCAAPAAGS
jgi:hypothetical protein